jgi:hypothetical protein
VDAVRVESVTGTSPYEAVVSAADRRYRVTLRRSRAPRCGPGCEDDLDSYLLGDLALLNEASLV